MPSQFSTSAIPCTASLLPPLHRILIYFTLWHPLTSPDRLNELSPYHSSLSNPLFPHHLQYFSSSVLLPKPPVTCFPLRPFPFVTSCPLCQYPLLPVLDSPFALHPCFFFHSELYPNIVLIHQRQSHAMGLLCHSATWLVGREREGGWKGGKGGRSREFALCLWRQENYGLRIASRWMPGRKLAVVKW